MNGSPATKRPRDLTPSSARSAKRQRAERADHADSPSVIRVIGQRIMSMVFGSHRQPAPPGGHELAPSSPRRHRAPKGRRAFAQNTSVIEISDTDDDADEEDAADQRRRRNQRDAARRHLNDHVPRGGHALHPDDVHCREATGPDSPERNIHPLLEGGPLFPSKFGGNPSPSPIPRPPSTTSLLDSSSTPATSSVGLGHRHHWPDASERPIRSYSWARSTSASSSESDRSVRPVRAWRRRSKPKKNMRSDADNSQLTMVADEIRAMESRGQTTGLDAFKRVEDELKKSEATRLSPKKKNKLYRVRSVGRVDSNPEFLGSFASDMRKTLDEASAPPEAKFELVRPVQKRPTLPQLERIDSPLHVKEQIRRTIVNEEIKRRLARVPAIPSELSREQEKIVAATLRNPHFKIEIGADEVHASSVQRLKPGVWLNDEVVNGYTQLMNARSKEQGLKVHCWTTYFYSKLSQDGYDGAKLKRWSKKLKLDIFSLDKMLVPINLNDTHWVCAVVDFRHERIEYYDSLEDHGRRDSAFKNLRKYLAAEHMEKKGVPLDLTHWQDIHNANTPRQDNSSDCGVFACQTLEMAARGRDLVAGKFEFNSSNMPFFRRLMIVEIASGQMAQRPWAL